MPTKESGLQPNDETRSVTKNSPQISVDDVLSAVLTCLDDNKAEDITSINLAGKTSIADHMVIASGRSARQVSALADYLVKKLKEIGVKGTELEGKAQADWVLIDAGDILVHLFRPEVRSFYNLDKMWATDMSDDSSPRETLN